MCYSGPEGTPGKPELIELHYNGDSLDPINFVEEISDHLEEQHGLRLEFQEVDEMDEMELVKIVRVDNIKNDTLIRIKEISDLISKIIYAIPRDPDDPNKNSGISGRSGSTDATRTIDKEIYDSLEPIIWNLNSALKDIKEIK